MMITTVSGEATSRGCGGQTRHARSRRDIYPLEPTAQSQTCARTPALTDKPLVLLLISASFCDLLPVQRAAVPVYRVTPRGGACPLVWQYSVSAPAGALRRTCTPLICSQSPRDGGTWPLRLSYPLRRTSRGSAGGSMHCCSTLLSSFPDPIPISAGIESDSRAQCVRSPCAAAEWSPLDRHWNGARHVALGPAGAVFVLGVMTTLTRSSVADVCCFFNADGYKSARLLTTWKGWRQSASGQASVCTRFSPSLSSLGQPPRPHSTNLSSEPRGSDIIAAHTPRTPHPSHRMGCAGLCHCQSVTAELRAVRLPAMPCVPKYSHDLAQTWLRMAQNSTIGSWHNLVRCRRPAHPVIRCRTDLAVPITPAACVHASS